MIIALIIMHVLLHLYIIYNSANYWMSQCLQMQDHNIRTQCRGLYSTQCMNPWWAALIWLRKPARQCLRQNEGHTHTLRHLVKLSWQSSVVAEAECWKRGTNQPASLRHNSYRAYSDALWSTDSSTTYTPIHTRWLSGSCNPHCVLDILPTTL